MTSDYWVIIRLVSKGRMSRNSRVDVRFILWR